MTAGCSNCGPTQMGPSMGDVCGGPTTYLFMVMLESLIKTMCDVEDPCGRLRDCEYVEDVYDFIVIGSGPAGSVIANRLSEVPQWKVLLLEAGGEEPTGTQVPSLMAHYLGTNLDWQYKTEPESKACLSYPEHRCDWPRGKVLGGTSVHNGMMYIRGSPRDFDHWEELGNTGWGFKEVLPYFKKSEDNRQLDLVDKGYHGTGGYMTIQQFNDRPAMTEDILAAGRELGYAQNDLNGRNNTGVSVAQTFSRNGARMSASKAFLRPIKNRNNFHALLNATASRILINPYSKQTYGVEYIKDGVTKNVFVRKEVVVSGGAVNSPQLLLLSGIGPREDLDQFGIQVIQNLPVGQNLHNHVGFELLFEIDEPPTRQLTNETSRMYLESQKGPMSSTGLSQITALVKSKYADRDVNQADLQLFFGGYLASCSKEGEKEEMESSEQKRHIGIYPTVLHPKSKGVLKLKSADPLEHPLIYANYLTDDYDVKMLVEGIKFGIALTKTEALRKYNFRLITKPVESCKEFEFGTDEYWACAVRYDTGAENHQAGSIKMGPADKTDSVVDPKLQVYGVKGLRVADASIMPEVTSGNTEGPTIMIGERAADFIKDKWLPKNTNPRIQSPNARKTFRWNGRPYFLHPYHNHSFHRQFRRS